MMQSRIHSIIHKFLLLLPPLPDITLLAKLLLKQVEYTETIHISETKASQLQVTNTTLTESLRLKEELIGNLLQELRTPLTHMKTALSLLDSKQIKKDQRQRYIELLRRECDRQNSLISGLLEWVQIDQTPELKSSTPNYLEDLVPGIVSTYQPLAEEKGIRLGYTIARELPPLSCPSNWLRQIIINLLNNSLKFTPPNGQVSVQASLRNECLELTVSDTGVGIVDSDLPKIFNSFYRGQNNSSKNIQGAGLGLTIVQQIIQRCGGSISVISKVDKGSKFKVLLPVVISQLED